MFSISEVLGIDIGVGMPSERVIRYLDQLAAWHGYPTKIRVDNGSEFCSFIFTQWAENNNIFIDYIKPGCPYQNAYIERFNRTRSEEHTSELQSRGHLVCRLLLEKKKDN